METKLAYRKICSPQYKRAKNSTFYINHARICSIVGKNTKKTNQTKDNMQIRRTGAEIFLPIYILPTKQHRIRICYAVVYGASATKMRAMLKKQDKYSAERDGSMILKRGVNLVRRIHKYMDRIVIEKYQLLIEKFTQ